MALRLAVSRLALQKLKTVEGNERLRKEIVALLMENKERLARVKVPFPLQLLPFLPSSSSSPSSSLED